jgi:hypothetical protein
LNFAAPLLLGLGALALPVTVLYILKVKRRRESVPYLRLWEELLVETRARSLFQRLKRLYSLLLQLLILGSIVFALSQPAFELASVKKESIVLLLDTSASMNALEDPETGRTRFDMLMERAAEFVEGRSFEDEMMLVAVNDRVDVLSSFNRNTIRLRAGLERLEPSERSLDAARAYDFAREVTRNSENPVILFLSDGAAGSITELIAEDENASLVVLGEAQENVGITRFAARKNTSLGTDYVLGMLKNFGSEEQTVRMELWVNDKTAKVFDETIPPGEEVQFNHELSFNEGGTLQLVLEHEDALAMDNRAWAIVRPTRLRKVILVADNRAAAEPFWVALEAMSEVVSPESFTCSPGAYDELSEEEKRADVTLCVGDLPENLSNRGNLILMNTPVPDFLPAQQIGIDPAPDVWDWDREHLLNRYLNFRDLPFPPARTLRLDSGTSLVTSFEGPLIAAFEQPGRMVVYVAFDMSASMFPFRLAFPMLLRNAIAWFEVEEDLVLEGTYAPGATIQPLRRVAGDEVTAVFQREGEWVERKLPVDTGQFYFTETEQPGGYMFRFGGASHYTAVNLFDASESNVAPEAIPEGAAGLQVDTSRSLFNRDLWTMLATLGLILWGLEWFTYHRRLTE